MIIAVYRNARDPVPEHADLPWPDVAREIVALVNEPSGAPEGTAPEEQKRRMIAWSPHALREGTTRALENVEHVSLLVVDVDAGPAPEDIVARLHNAGVAGVVYDSPSATADAPRYRVVCPVVAPIAPEDCRDTRLRFAAALGLAPDCGVKGAIDASKLFFAGRIHGTPPRRAWIVDGGAVDAAALEPCPDPTWYTAPPAPALATHLTDLPPATSGIAAALGPWTAHQGRKWLTCGAVGGVMRKMGFSAAQCESEIRAWLPPDDPAIDVSAGVTWALGAWARDPADVSGHDELARILGHDHAAVVEAAAYAGTPWARASVRAREAAPRSPFAFASGGAPVGDPLGVRHLYAEPERAIEYLCASLCLAPCTGKISIIGGLPNAGKGPLADYLAVCFAMGLPAFGRFVLAQQAVLLLDYEGARLTMRRTRRMARALGVDPRTLDDALEVRDTTAIHPFDPGFMDALAAHPARVVIVDSYTSALLVTSLDPNKNEFATFARNLAQLDKLVIAVAHARKPAVGAHGERPTLGDIAGSGALGAMAFTGISCWKPDDENPYRVRVGCMRAPEKGFEQFDVTFKDVDGDGLALEFMGATEVKRADDAVAAGEVTQNVRRVLAFLRRSGMPEHEKEIKVADAKGGAIAGARLGAILGMLEASGLVVRQPGTRGSTYQVRHAQDARDVKVVGGTVIAT